VKTAPASESKTQSDKTKSTVDESADPSKSLKLAQEETSSIAQTDSADGEEGSGANLDLSEVESAVSSEQE
jgi:hypothetical protein